MDGSICYMSRVRKANLKMAKPNSHGGQEAQRLSPANPKILRVLAAARAESGDYTHAVVIAKQATELANHQGETGLAETLQPDLLIYESGKPLRD